MGPKSRQNAAEHDLFRMELVNLIDQRHELVKLAALIDWPAFEQAWGPKFESTTGRPALPTRLMASLLYLKHTFALSDEDVVERWIENPYWQHFSGERYFRHELPCDPSSLVRWRQRIGEEGCEWLLEHSIKAAVSAGMMKRQSLDTVIVDTTVQPKAIAHPTDSRLLNRAREQLVAAAQEAGIELRQSYARVGKTADAQAGRYAHAQHRDSKNKLYALHAPEVECIAKGKARTPYELGVKTSVAVTAKEGVVVGMRLMPGSPYDGHMLHSQLEQVEILTGVKPAMALADRGYRGVVPPDGTRLLISHTRGLPLSLKKLLKRRQAIEPTFGHMKTDGLLARNWLKGSDGDAIHAVLCGAWHNLRLILRTCGCFSWPCWRCSYRGRSALCRRSSSYARLCSAPQGLFRADYVDVRTAERRGAQTSICEPGKLKKLAAPLPVGFPDSVPPVWVSFDLPAGDLHLTARRLLLGTVRGPVHHLCRVQA